MPVRVERRELVSWVVIDREDKGNSLDYDHAVQLAKAIRGECSSSETVVVAVRGVGKRFFSTGVDLSAVAGVRSIEDGLKLMYEGLGGVCRAVLECRKPVIAAVNGHAVGIGFELVNAADMAWAVKWAKLGSPAVKWGMVPPGTTTMGPLLVGVKHASYIVLTARLVSAEEAYRMGFLNGVVDSLEELETTVNSVAKDIAANDRWAVEQALALLRSTRIHAFLDLGVKTLTISTVRRETVERALTFIRKA